MSAKKKSSLLEHCERCSKLVATWPAWKSRSMAIPIQQESQAQFEARKAAQRAYDYWPGD